MGCTTGQACFNDACVAPPERYVCARNATRDRTPVNGSTAGAKHNYDMGLETTAAQASRNRDPMSCTRLDLTATQQITVTLSNLAATYDGSIALVGPGAATICDATTIACIAGEDNGLDGGNGDVLVHRDGGRHVLHHRGLRGPRTSAARSRST